MLTLVCFFTAHQAEDAGPIEGFGEIVEDLQRLSPGSGDDGGGGSDSAVPDRVTLCLLYTSPSPRDS